MSHGLRLICDTTDVVDCKIGGIPFPFHRWIQQGVWGSTVTFLSVQYMAVTK